MIELGGARVLVLLEPLVDADDVHELVGEVVLRTLAVLKDDGRAHRDRGYREDGEDGPLGAGDVRVDTERDQVLVRDLLHPGADVGRGELVLHLLAFLDHDFGERGRFLEVDLELLFAAVRADALLLDILFREQVAGLVVLRTDYLLDFLRAQEHAAAGTAGDTQEFPNEPRVAYVDDGLGELDVAEVAGALARLLVAGLAPETRIDDPEVQVHEALGIGKAIVIIGVGPDDLPDTHLADLLGG